MIQPYYSDDAVTLYLGDMREILPALGVHVDAVVTDPPYGETSLEWDRWPQGWPPLVAAYTRSMWCFGSMRMFTDHWGEFDGWRFSQDIVWEKHNGSGFAADRFKRVHEYAAHFYRGDWRSIYHETPRERGNPHKRTCKGVTDNLTTHTGAIRANQYEDDGQRLIRSVIRVRSMHSRAIHPTEKPSAILDPLIRYAVPRDGTVLDPFAGSASTLFTARALGRKAVGIEAREDYCEAAAERLSVPDLFGGAA